MANGVQIAAALCFGLLLGGCYFGGLWWTVHRLLDTRHVWRTLLASLVIRLTVVLLSFYFVLTRFGWQTLLSCLFGFWLARLSLIHWLGRSQLDLLAKPELLAKPDLERAP